MRRTDANCHGSFLGKIADGRISLSRVKGKERRNVFCSIHKGGFMLRSKLRRKMSAIPAPSSAQDGQGLSPSEFIAEAGPCRVDRNPDILDLREPDVLILGAGEQALP